MNVTGLLLHRRMVTTWGPADNRVRLRRQAVVVALVTFVTMGCGTVRGRLPRIDGPDERAGFKMLRPNAEARACEGVFVGQGGSRDLVAEVIATLLARDDEATTIVHAELEWSWTWLGIYTRRCVRIRGDVVRPTSTVMIPMAHHHAAAGPTP